MTFPKVPYFYQKPPGEGEGILCEIFCKIVAFPNKERYNIPSERKLEGKRLLLALPAERRPPVPACPAQRGRAGAVFIACRRKCEVCGTKN